MLCLPLSLCCHPCFHPCARRCQRAEVRLVVLTPTFVMLSSLQSLANVLRTLRSVTHTMSTLLRSGDIFSSSPSVPTQCVSFRKFSSSLKTVLEFQPIVHFVSWPITPVQMDPYNVLVCMHPEQKEGPC